MQVTNKCNLKIQHQATMQYTTVALKHYSARHVHVILCELHLVQKH